MADPSAYSRKKSSCAVVLVGISMVLACGRTRNVLEHGPDDGDGGEEVAQGAAGGSGGVNGSAGTLSGAGQAGSAGAGGRAATWDSRQCHATPVAEPSDPIVRARWLKARDYCATLGAHDCFKTGVIDVPVGCDAEQLIDACMAQALWFHDQEIAPECEGAWSKVFECGASSGSDAGLCTETNVVGLPAAPNATCSAENAALVACAEQYRPSDGVEVVGTYATCHYASGPSSCTVQCPVGQYSAKLTCKGADGLPKQCGCQINDHAVTAYAPIFVNDCADAAQQAADGLCSSLIDCCFEYVDGKKQSCLCVDPASYGYNSCQAMMAVAAGQKVDICPALSPKAPSAPEGGCWPPGGCDMSEGQPNLPPPPPP